MSSMIYVASRSRASLAVRLPSAAVGPALHTKTTLRQTETTQAGAAAGAAAVPDKPAPGEYALSEDQRRSLNLSSQALRRWGWVSFWIQLALSLVSTGILLFSIAFTTVTGPRVSLYMVLFAIIASIFSTFWAFGYTRLSRKVKRYADARVGPEVQSKVVKKKDVKKTLRNGLTVNVLGMGSALLGLQAMVGMLVAKTLSSASVNPFFAGQGSSQLNPVVALDVFLVQAATNTLLSHFTSLVLCFLLLRSVDR